MKNNESRYSYITYDGKDGVKVVVCLSSYAGKTVKGVAKCSPEDKYDEEFGKRLARARCDEKIAYKRFSRATNKFNSALDLKRSAVFEYNSATEYMSSASDSYEEAHRALNELESSICGCSDGSVSGEITVNSCDPNYKAEKLLMDNGYEGAKFLTDYSYDTAIVGVTEDNRVIYDFEKMVEWLVGRDGITSEEEAIEWIEYNTIRALPYMGYDAPIIMYPVVDFEE